MATKSQRIEELETEIRRHAALYFNETPEISDAEFDEMVDELRKADPDSEVLNEVGAIPSYGREVRHPSVMGSLDKAKTSTEITDWYSRYTRSSRLICASHKIDGCFHADSKVMLANGEERPISEITRGMNVLTLNEKTGENEVKKVLSVLVRSAANSRWLSLTLESGEIIVCTEEHLFLTTNRGWIPAKELSSEDNLEEPNF